MKKILIIEDNQEIAELEQDFLEANAIESDIETDGIKGLDRALHGTYALILLDIMLPGMDGFHICKRIRAEKEVPILMVSAKREDIDKIRGLGLGADDYIVKPFETKEVMARIKAVLRRSGADGQKKYRELRYDKLTINMETFEMRVNGKPVDTPPKEMELIYHLASNPNRVFTRDQLLDEVWGFEYYGDSRTVDVHIKRLREKLDGVSPQWTLKTVWGVGYKFEVKDDFKGD